MTENVSASVPLSPLMQSWLDDVSSLLGQINELGAELESKKDYISAETAERMRDAIRRLKAALITKNNELAGYQAAERVLRESITALQQELSDSSEANRVLRDELAGAVSAQRAAEETLARREAEFNAGLEEQAQEFSAHLQKRDNELSSLKQTNRQLRLDLAKEAVDGYKRAQESIRKAHALDVARNHQIGKDKGIAIASAYIDAAKEEGADLERASQLASSVVIQSAKRMESGLDIHEAETVADGSGTGGLPGTRQEITMRDSTPLKTR